MIRYRGERRQDQYEAADAISSVGAEEVDIEKTLEELKEARRTVAERRRAQAF